MDSGLLILGALAYCAVAIWLVVLGAKRSKPGLARICIVAAIFTLFFSVSVLVQDGVVPVPALTIVVWCLFGDCTEMYGSWGGLIWGLLPMLVQWALLLIVFLAFRKLARIVARKSTNGA